MDNYILLNTLNEYLKWADNERKSASDLLRPTVLIFVTMNEIKSLGVDFTFLDATNLSVTKFQKSIDMVIKNRSEFPEKL